eukprot:scaffold20763_cov116-Isochrysis_galbana.AAC.3
MCPNYLCFEQSKFGLSTATTVIDAYIAAAFAMIPLFRNPFLLPTRTNAQIIAQFLNRDPNVERVGPCIPPRHPFDCWHNPERERAAIRYTTAFVRFHSVNPSRQSGMVQPVVQEMFATVHAAGSSLFGARPWPTLRAAINSTVQFDELRASPASSCTRRLASSRRGAPAGWAYVLPAPDDPVTAAAAAAMLDDAIRRSRSQRPAHLRVLQPPRRAAAP